MGNLMGIHRPRQRRTTMEDILNRLISIVQDAAPALWAIARRQVLASIAGNAIWILFLVIATGVLAWATRFYYGRYTKWREWKQREHHRQIVYDDDDGIGGMTFAILGAVFTTFLMFVLVTGMVKYLINPDYYAIQVLLNLVK